MSLSTQLTRLARNVGALTADTNAIFEALRAKGVNVPANAQLSDVADMIESINPPHQNEVEIGGRWYPYVQIGNQLWLAENLDYKFSGCEIGPSSSPRTPAAWYYNNDEVTYGIDGTRKCGLMYNWYAVKYLDDNKATLCPGWHVASASEWSILVNGLGGSSIAASKLKALDNSATSGFPSGWGGTDDYGFGVLPTGRYVGLFNGIGESGQIWTITENNNSAEFQYFDSGESTYSIPTSKDEGRVLRLVKDVN